MDVPSISVCVRYVYVCSLYLPLCFLWYNARVSGINAEFYCTLPILPLHANSYAYLRTTFILFFHLHLHAYNHRQFFFCSVVCLLLLLLLLCALLQLFTAYAYHQRHMLAFSCTEREKRGHFRFLFVKSVIEYLHNCPEA